MRSKLFVPGSRPDIFIKALSSKADAISFDLEDSVHESQKGGARQAVVEMLESEVALASNKLIIVRVNGPGHPEFNQDVKAIVSSRLDIINVPMVETVEDVAATATLLESVEQDKALDQTIAILANIETPKGLRNAAEIACSSPRIMGLQIGFADLFGPLGIDRSDPIATKIVRFNVRMAAAEAGIDAYDAAFLNVKDKEALRLDAEGAKRLGYSGKSCIHPTQIDVVNSAFMPSAEELKTAELVLESARQYAAQGNGVFTLNGQMIDKPVIEAARKIVQLGTLNN